MKRSSDTPIKLSQVDFQVGEVLVVEWLDAHNLDTGWCDIAEVPFRRTQVHTVGHFIGVAEDQLWLAADYCQADKIVNTIAGIPVGWITSVKKVDLG